MYKGRTNYETWAAETYLQSDQERYNLIKGRLDYFMGMDSHGDNTAAFTALARQLAETFGGSFPASLRGTLYGDLLQNALLQVNWLEVAQSFKEE